VALFIYPTKYALRTHKRCGIKSTVNYSHRERRAQVDRNNILATIADLIAELGRIEATRNQIEASIKTLSQLLESPLFAVESTITPTRSVRTKFPHLKEGGEGPIPSERLHSALDKMQGRFKRGDLKDNAINDGSGAIAEGTFANIFIKMIKRKQIVCVEGTVGQRDAVFMKAEAKKVSGMLDLPFGDAPQ
jgi:hypothetical protein